MVEGTRLKDITDTQAKHAEDIGLISQRLDEMAASNTTNQSATERMLSDLKSDFKVAMDSFAQKQDEMALLFSQLIREKETDSPEVLSMSNEGLQADHTFYMVRGFAPATPASSTHTNAVNASNSPVVGQSGVPNSGLGSAGAHVFPGLDLGALGRTRAPGLFGAGFPEFEQVQQQLTRNPNATRDLMSLPTVQNPQMRDIVDRNPELGHILNDPGTLRQTLEAARNPELMREMMRNTDRAMSNIKSSPEGFNALRGMYENVQEPFMKATTMAGSGAAADTGSNPFAALLGNQGGNQTRDVTNSASVGTETTSENAASNASPLPNSWDNNAASNTNMVPFVSNSRSKLDTENSVGNLLWDGGSMLYLKLTMFEYETT